MKPSTAQSVVDAVNGELDKFTINKYERHVPYDRIGKYLDGLGFRPPSEDDHPFALMGHDGRVTIEYAHDEYPSKNFWLQLSWHRMPSGNFEVVAVFQVTAVRRKEQTKRDRR